MTSDHMRLHNYLLSEVDPAFAVRAHLIFTAALHKKPKKILDVGCGRGFYVQTLSEFKSVERIDGIEIEPEYLAQARQTVQSPKVHLQLGSVYELPFKSKSFDMVVLSEVLEHLTNEAQALAEIKRVLKPDGWLVLTVPSIDFPFAWDPLNWLLMRLFQTHVNKDIWWLAGIWAGHQRLYSTKQLISVLQKNGFGIRAYHPVVRHCWPATHFWLYGIGKNLVERCGLRSFSRFNLQAKRPIAKVVALVMSLPERWFGQWLADLVLTTNLHTTKQFSNQISANHFCIAEPKPTISGRRAD
jgi:ubiquinone/menaquinone biosynthesis C-methylase UbiE